MNCLFTHTKYNEMHFLPNEFWGFKRNRLNNYRNFYENYNSEWYFHMYVMWLNIRNEFHFIFNINEHHERAKWIFIALIIDYSTNVSNSKLLEEFKMRASHTSKRVSFCLDIEENQFRFYKTVWIQIRIFAQLWCNCMCLNLNMYLTKRKKNTLNTIVKTILLEIVKQIVDFRATCE